MRSVLFHVVVALVALVAVVPLASGQTSPRPLQAGAPIEQSISGTDVHAYTVRADANSTLAAIVMQKGVDVVVSLYAPDGTRLVEVDSPNGTNGPEPLTMMLETAGTYRIQVKRLPDPSNAPTGSYEVRLETLRPATAAELGEHADRKALTSLEEQWEAALERTDLDALARIISNDFYYFNPGPGGMGRAERLSMWAEQKKSNSDVTETHTVTDRTVRIFGDMAVSAGGAIIKLARPKGTTTLQGRFVHVWQKQNGTWKLSGDHFYADGSEPIARVEVAVAGPDLAGHAGTYQFADGTQVTVSAEAGGLVIRPKDPAGPWSLPFVAESPNEFFSKAGDYQLVFVKNTGAVGDRCLFFDRGRAIRGAKVSQ